MLKSKKYWGAPGTGKTTTLLREIKTLIHRDGYSQSDFVVCTFSRKMADELQEKLNWNRKEDGGIVNTVHGVCRGLANINKVVRESNQAEFCEMFGYPYQKSKASELDDDEDETTIHINSRSKLGNIFFDANSFLINNLFPPEKITQYNEIEKLEREVPNPVEFMRSTAAAYRKWKQDNKLYDFDDMLQIVHDDKLVPPARVLIVDEFQDLTPLQYGIVRMWSANMELVIIAGDPRQTLYGYRGASSKFFENFEGDLVILNTTYRLPANIWNYARSILAKAGLSSPKIKTTGKPGILKAITETAYYERMNAPAFQEHTMHLVRTNEMGVNIAYALTNYGIPFTGIGGWGKHQITLYNALLKVKKGMNGEAVSISQDELEEILDTYYKDEFTDKKENIKRKYKDSKLTSFTFKQIKPIAKLDLMGRRGLWHRIAAGAIFENALGKYSDPESFVHKKITRAIANHKKLITTPTVRIRTIHGAKGSEEQTVFLHDEINRIIADQIYVNYNKDLIESEAQVFYVGATRAIQSLFIVESNEKYRYALPEITEGTL